MTGADMTVFGAEHRSGQFSTKHEDELAFAVDFVFEILFLVAERCLYHTRCHDYRPKTPLQSPPPAPSLRRRTKRG